MIRPGARATEALRPSAPAVILFLLTLVVLKLAQPLLVPFALALFFYFLLMPLVLALGRWRVPRAIAAGSLVMLVLVLLSLAAGYALEPASRWMSELPRLTPSIKAKLSPVSEPIAMLEEAATEVEDLASPDNGERSETVRLEGGAVTDDVLLEATGVLVSAGVVVFLTFFFLTFGERLQQKIARLGRNFSEQRRLVAIGRTVQSEISRYLGVIALINLGLAVVVSALFWVLDVPNYLLWGGLAGVANFVPYAGPAAMTVVFVAVGLVSFESLADAMLVPACFLVVTVLEGQLVTPMLLGGKLDMSPAIVFLAVIFWAYMWGLGGALVAVPIIVSTKIVLSHIPSLRPVAALFGR